MKRIPKEWFITIGCSVIGDQFIDWIGGKITERNEAVKVDNHMNVAMNPDVYEAFMNSTAVSCKYSPLKF